MKLSYAVFLLVAVIFFSLTVAPSYLSSAGYVGMSSFAFMVFAPFCHQLPERSFYAAGWQMPVCARCFGIYAGILLGTLIYPFAYGGKIPRWQVILAAAAPLAVDGITQLFLLRESTNLLRLMTGLIFGLIIPYCLIPVLDDMLSGREIFIGRR
jgi:uncharacterized membrane protein